MAHLELHVMLTGGFIMPPVSIEGKPFASIKMLDKLVSNLEDMLNALQPHKEDNKYVIFAVRDLAWMSLSIISAVARQLHWRYSAYTATSMTRLLMECITEIKYVKSHPKKAKSFWMSQKKIQDLMKAAESEEEKWKLFSDGELNKYGQLSNSSIARMRTMLGEEDLGRYNLFCFYSHPNIAGYSWVSRDKSPQPGITVRFAAETCYKMIDELLIALSTLESQTLNIAELRTHLYDIYDQYTSECENQL